MKIRRTMIEVVPHHAQRMETVGDYWIDPFGVKHVRVSDMSNEAYEFLVTVHELVEEFLTRRRGLTEPEITAFDEQFERERMDGLHSDTEEPGFAPDCPYLREHMIATGIEMQLAGIIGLDWQTYEQTVNSLGQDEPLTIKSVEGVSQTDIR